MLQVNDKPFFEQYVCCAVHVYCSLIFMSKSFYFFWVALDSISIEYGMPHNSWHNIIILFLKDEKKATKALYLYTCCITYLIYFSVDILDSRVYKNLHMKKNPNIKEKRKIFFENIHSSRLIIHVRTVRTLYRTTIYIRKCFRIL